jgi:hypothetical protein
MSTGILDKTSFYFNMGRKGRLFNIESDSDARDFCSNIDVLITFLKQEYPDRWQILPEPLSVGDKYELCLYLHYPHTTIWNQHDDYHDIEDMFVKFNIVYFNENKSIGFTGMEAFRTTFTMAEICSSYVHSHLNKCHFMDGASPFTRQNFCTGESDIETMLGNMVLEPISLDYLQVLKFNLDGFLSWESIDGVPHIHLENISDNAIFEEGSQERYELPNGVFELMFSEVCQRVSNEELKLDFKIVQGYPRVVLNTELKETVKDILIDQYLPIYYHNFFCRLLSSSGVERDIISYCLPSRERIIIPDVIEKYDGSFFMFRDKKFYFNVSDIENYQQEEIEEPDYREELRSFTVKDILINNLEKRINEHVEKIFTARNAGKSELTLT